MQDTVERKTISLRPALLKKAEEKAEKEFYPTFSAYIAALIKEDVSDLKGKKKAA